MAHAAAIARRALLAVALLACTLAEAAAPASAVLRSPLLGAWSVDLERLPVPPEARPRSVTITFTDAGAGKLSIRVAVVDGEGHLMQSESVAPLDGTPVAATGNLEADVVAARMPAPGVLVMQLSLKGVPGSTRVYTVSADGQAMTEVGANFGDDGRPRMRVNSFSRVR